MIKGVRLYRLKAGYNTSEAANLLGIKVNTLYKIEQGYIKPSLSLLNTMRNVYKCTSDELLESLGLHREVS